MLLRALNSSRIVGHAYFWALNAALYDPYSFERIYLHYERFLFLCPHFRNEMYLQSRINEAIIDTNYLSINDQKLKISQLTDHVNMEIDKIKAEMNIDYFILPHIPAIPLECIEEFNTRNSKNHTIMITCKTESTNPDDKIVKALFKQDKDLRKDQVAIQAFKIFDNFCLEQSVNGKPLNLGMTTYVVLSTGYKMGYIEIVPHSENLLTIHKKHDQWNKFPLSYTIVNNLKKIVNQRLQKGADSGDKYDELEYEVEHTETDQLVDQSSVSLILTILELFLN